MAYEKLYNEIYAVVFLRYFWKEYRPGFVKWESPDWVNRAMDFGMEVSQALLPYDGQSESFLEHYLGHLREEIPQSALEKYEGKLYFYNGRLWALLSDEENQVPYQEKVLIRFERKLQKLNSHYTHFACNALYLYAHAEPQDLGEVREILQAMQQQQSVKPQRFQKVFLDCKSRVYVLDFPEDKVQEILIPEKAQMFLEAEAEMLRHSMDWVNGTPF